MTLHAIHSSANACRDFTRRRQYVAYYRVSTPRQAETELGLDAQRASVRGHVEREGGKLVGEFSESISGRKNDRPQLNEALRVCRYRRATLIVGRLDRLSRNLGFTTQLMESGLDFVAVDFPHANRFTIHVLAALAEYEANLISERLRAAFAAAKARGAKFGGWRGQRPTNFAKGELRRPTASGSRSPAPAPAISRRSFGSLSPKVIRSSKSPTNSIGAASLRQDGKGGAWRPSAFSSNGQRTSSPARPT